jgi:hypothetical protein
LILWQWTRNLNSDTIKTRVIPIKEESLKRDSSFVGINNTIKHYLIKVPDQEL